MLEQVKAYTDFTDETDVLAELQHYGGKTNLIDFTTDYLIALFFACDGSPDEDGRVILLDKTSNQATITSPKKNQNNRVISQKIIFFQSSKGYLDKQDCDAILIPKEMKQPFRDYLRKYHGITTQTIYNDLFGYIQNQEKHQGAYTEFYIGLTFHEKGEYQQEIEHYGRAICINPQLAAAYNNRGLAKGTLSLYPAARVDYDQAIRLNPQYAEAYNNRGLVKHALGQPHAAIAQYHDAVADYNQAIRLNPQLAKACSNRGFAKHTLGLYHDALADCDQAISINPQLTTAYHYRGVIYKAIGSPKRHAQTCNALST